MDNYTHIREVTAPLVLARPQYGDQPLWNADEVRGKILLVMRGPPPPHEGTSYATKVYHAQKAGAVGVIIVLLSKVSI
jgi:hypothetical protein